MNDCEILEWLEGFCVPGEAGCMIWRGAVSTAKGKSELPTVRHPVLLKNMPARRVLLMAMGVKIDGKCCTTSCRDPMCMAPAHAEAVTRKELQRRSAPKVAGNLLRRAKMTAAARARSEMTMERAREIRNAGMRPTDAAKHFDIPFQQAVRIISGRGWREISSPWTGLGA